MGSHKRPVVALGTLAVLLVALVVLRGEDGERRAPAPGDRVSPRVSASPSPGAPSRGATAPLRTAAGALRLSRVHLRQEVCPRVDGSCRQAPRGERFVVLRLSAWDGRDIVVTDDLARQAERSSVTAGARTAGFAALGRRGGSGPLEVAYGFVPESAVEAEMRLAWPGSPPLRLRFGG